MNMRFTPRIGFWLTVLRSFGTRTMFFLDWNVLKFIVLCFVSRWIDAATYQQYFWASSCHRRFRFRQRVFPYNIQRGAHKRMSAMDDENIMNNEYSFLERVRESLRTENVAYEKEWEESLRFLSELKDDYVDSPSSVQLEAALSTAWNWKRWAIVTSPMARKFVRTIPPNSAAVASSIQWLQQAPLQLTNDIILQGILEAPEAYLLNPQENYAQVLRVAPPEYLDPAAFRALLMRHPAALRCTYNCASTGCNSECGNCWVSFAYQMSEARTATADTLF
jgi:hypothetical protein